jgi:hypothetical protein
MYTPIERDSLRKSLIATARADERIIGAALTGSAASNSEDRWSDIDLAFGVAPNADFNQTIADFSEVMYNSNGAIDHLDVKSGTWIYRVFFLANTLQVDLGFSPADHFGALAPTHRMLFGTSTKQAPRPKPDVRQLVGWGWLYALHVRSSLARDRYWQAEYMISGMRNQVLALACLRYDLPTSEGRGFDGLPCEVTARVSEALVSSLDPERLSQAFVVVIEALIAETLEVDSALAERLIGPLRELAS